MNDYTFVEITMRKNVLEQPPFGVLFWWKNIQDAQTTGIDFKLTHTCRYRI